MIKADAAPEPDPSIPAAEPLILPPTVADPRLFPASQGAGKFFAPGPDPPEQAREVHGCKAVPEVAKPP
jgi:hypothetical protein